MNNFNLNTPELRNSTSRTLLSGTFKGLLVKISKVKKLDTGFGSPDAWRLTFEVIDGEHSGCICFKKYTNDTLNINSLRPIRALAIATGFYSKHQSPDKTVYYDITDNFTIEKTEGKVLQIDTQSKDGFCNVQNERQYNESFSSNSSETNSIMSADIQDSESVPF